MGNMGKRPGETLGTNHEQDWRKYRIARRDTLNLHSCSGGLVEGDGCAHMMCHVCGAYPDTRMAAWSGLFGAFQVTVLRSDDLVEHMRVSINGGTHK